MCGECGARAELDARHGERVCTSCGLVLTRSINVEREYVAPADAGDDGFRRTYDPYAVPGVQRYLVMQNLAHVVSDEAERPSSRYEDLEHWNHYTQHREDALRSIDRQLAAWRDPAHGPDCRLCAALLYPLLRGQLADDAAVRDRLSSNSLFCASAAPDRFQRPLEPIRGAPAPTHACVTCGAMVHTRKDARFHCRLAEHYAAAGSGKRARW